MQCQNCGAENPDGMRFCGYCGRPLATGVVSPPPTPSSSLPASAPEPTASSHAERRQLTVMFCDLVGSTALSLELDPEELREVVRSYQETCVAVIEAFAGYTAQYLGDGILVYFGYPVAREHEAARAVRAGLQILEAIQQLNRRLQEQYSVSIGVRISLHTGIVVIGQMGGAGRHEHLALGTTPNLAARLQSLALPGTLVVSSSTYQLLRDSFVYEDLGRHQLKGLSEPINVYRVVGERDDADFEDISSQETLLVGRRTEIDLLLERWQEAAAGRGQAVLVCGEAGIGKSNLTSNLLSRLRDTEHTVLVCRCEPHCQNSAFYPVMYMLQRALNFYPGQPSEERLDIIEFMLERNGISTPEAAPLLARLLSIPTEGRYDTSDSGSGDVRTALRHVLQKVLLQTAEEQPVLLVFEDLHWADPSTVELIGSLLNRIPQLHLLLLLTFRPTFHPPWPARSFMAQVTLNRLSAREAAKLIHAMTRGKRLPDPVLQEIVEKADGVPLFVEELTKTVLELGLLKEERGNYVLTSPLPPLAIPASLQDSLMARLDRLSPVKELAQLGATIGREFSYGLIRAVSPLSDEDLAIALSQLVDAELLHRYGNPPKATYVFKHALIQDAAYESLLKSRRQQYHQRIAEALTATFPDVCAAQPELPARHYTAAGLYAHAVPYWQRAGERAAQKSAYAEAAHHFSQGLQALDAVGPAPERTAQRLTLLAGLGAAQTALHGYMAPEVGRTYDEAHALLSQTGYTSHVTAVFAGLFAHHFVLGRFRKAESLAAEMLEYARNTEDPEAVTGANVAMGAALCMLGQLAQGRRHLEEALSGYRPGERFALAFMGQDLGVVATAYLAHTLWALGYPEQAVQRMQELPDLARRLDHPHSLAFSLFFSASLLYHLREMEQAAAYARELAEVAERYGFRHWQVESALILASLGADEEDAADALAKINGLIREHPASLADNDLPNYHPYLPETYLRLGAWDEALAYLELSLEKASAQGDTLWTSEMWRLKGEALLLQGAAPSEAEACFGCALDIARQKGARALELRVILSLAKLWKTPERRIEGQGLLQHVLDEFTEGDATAEFKQAQHLLTQA